VSSQEKLLPAIASLVVLPPWIWLAVRTKNCLQAITAHSIPFPKRTIWLIKMLALIIGAGGVLGAAPELGMPWLVAIMLSSTVVFFAVRERVQEVVPPKPVQDYSAYQASWRQCRQLRSTYMWSCTWFGAIGVALILVAAFADRLPKTVQIGLFPLCLVAAIAAIAVMSYRQLKWLRWPCPRCGCAFRGLWRPWLPRNCVYCGLPREGNAIDFSHANSR
jgi:hypothetical protein